MFTDLDDAFVMSSPMVSSFSALDMDFDFSKMDVPDRLGDLAIDYPQFTYNRPTAAPQPTDELTVDIKPVRPSRHIHPRRKSSTIFKPFTSFESVELTVRGLRTCVRAHTAPRDFHF
jgi:hypothetical protein